MEDKKKEKSFKSYFAKTTAFVNCRKQPGVNEDLARDTPLRPNTLVKVIEEVRGNDGQIWAKIKTADKEEYVCRDFLEVK